MAAEQPRLIVFAYSDVGHACLQQLIASKCNIVAVFTHEDNPNENQWFSSVAELAKANDIAVYTPEKLKRSEWQARFMEALRPDLMLSFYYRNMIPSWLLEVPRLGAFNMHGSYLPKYRGRAPVNWAVLHGETSIGATLHVMVKQADAGDIVDQEAVPIGPNDPAIDVMKRVRNAAVTVLARQIVKLQEGRIEPTAQDESQVTYYGGRKPEDGRIDWHMPARDIYNLIRAVTKPYPGAFSNEIFDGKRTIVWWAKVIDEIGEGIAEPGTIVSNQPLLIACGTGVLELVEFEVL